MFSQILGCTGASQWIKAISFEVGEVQQNHGLEKVYLRFGVRKGIHKSKGKRKILTSDSN